MKKLLTVAMCAVALACAGITGPNYPDVAGTYRGPLTVTSTITPGSITGTMIMTVVQAGDQLTITGSVTFLDETSQLPAITGTINETGFFTVTAGGSSPRESHPECGSMTTTSSTLNFSDQTARFHQSVSTTYCGSLSFDATLTR